MDINNILSYVDHTLLGQTASEVEIKNLLNDGIKYNVASCCISPSFVKMAKAYVGDKLPICTVIGFPNGYSVKEVKVFETKKAIEDGADEIDMVINLGWVKDNKYELILDEIKAVKAACADKVLKVIIEACLLNDEEKIKLCQIVTDAKADYIKTSTGFSTGGATLHDITLFSQNIGPDVKIKAAGGISSLEDAKAFLDLGAKRLGTSRIVKIAKESGL